MDSIGRNLSELEQVARLLMMRPASNEDLRDAVLCLIDGFRRLAGEMQKTESLLAGTQQAELTKGNGTSLRTAGKGS